MDVVRELVGQRLSDRKIAASIFPDEIPALAAEDVEASLKVLCQDPVRLSLVLRRLLTRSQCSVVTEVVGTETTYHIGSFELQSQACDK